MCPAVCDIPAGAELHLDYGDLFFDDDSSNSTSSDADRALSKNVESLPPSLPDLTRDEVVYSLDQHSSDETYEFLE
ncbi:hypothetical protein H0H87_001819 [Tephrocybe sp. NHM501043]|nr:hypothetical protein H0H87_001819 [Tephrocybe sp. NHM501043]